MALVLPLEARISQVLNIVYEQKTIDSESDGVSQSAAVGIVNERVTATIMWERLSSADKAIVLSTILAAKGVSTFQFTLPDDTPRLFRVRNPSITVESGVHYTVSVKLTSV